MTKRKDKYFGITPFVTGILLIMQRVLISATIIPEYNQMHNRYYMYQFLSIIAMIGVNLLPLYIGFYSKEISKKNALKKLSRYYFIYLILILSSNILFLIKDAKLNIRDYWVPFFPISQNVFPYAVSIILTLLVVPYLVNFFQKLNDSQLKIGISLASILTIVLPTLFGKDIWGFQEGAGVVWSIYLASVGYILKRFEIVPRIKFKLLHLIVSVSILFTLVIVMVQVSKYLHGDLSTATRFSIPFSIFGMYFTISMFACLESNRIHNLIPLKITSETLITFWISVQVITNWVLTVYMINSYYRKDFPNDSRMWLIWVFIFIGLYLLASIFFSIMGISIQHLSVYQRFYKKFEVSSTQDILDKAYSISLWIKRNKRLLYVGIFFYFFTILQMLSISDLDNQNKIIKAILNVMILRQAPVMLNVIIIMTFFLLLYLLTLKFWYAFFFTLFIDVILTISNIIKIELRAEPILPADLTMLNGIGEVFNMISPIIIVIGVLLLLLFTVTSIILQRRLSKLYSIKIRRKKRLIGIMIMSLLFSGIFWINHQGSISNTVFKFFKVNNLFYDQKQGARMNGPIIQFLINIDIKVMDEPDNYSEETIEKIISKYNSKAISINQSRKEWSDDQTIIFVLSESFSDPFRIPNLEVKSDPIPYVRSLINNTTGGVMLSSGYGGGTANIEWETLTGMDMSNLSATLPTPYTQLVNRQKFSPNITNLFEMKTAIHPYVANLYKRKDVFSKFGFDSFYHVDSKDKLKYTDKIGNNPYISDEAGYKEVLRLVNKTKNKTHFIQLSTMQNHLPYEKDYYETQNYSFEGSAINGNNRESFNTYLQGIHYTDEAVKDFIKEINKIQKPITVIWYGDHLPGLFSESNLKKYGLLHHETDYFVLNNNFGTENLKNMSNTKIISPYNFPALALKQAGIKVTGFYALLTKVQEILPASTTDPSSSESNTYNGEKVFVNQDNKIIGSDSLSNEQKEILSDYLTIQYDLTAGEQYSAKWAMNQED